MLAVENAIVVPGEGCRLQGAEVFYLQAFTERCDVLASEENLKLYKISQDPD
jgi:hypothetical protein